MRTRHAPAGATIIAFLSMMMVTSPVAEALLCRCEENPGALERVPSTYRVTFDEQSGYYMVDGVIVLPYGSNKCADEPWRGFANMFNNDDDGNRHRNLVRQRLQQEQSGK